MPTLIIKVLYRFCGIFVAKKMREALFDEPQRKYTKPFSNDLIEIKIISNELRAVGIFELSQCHFVRGRSETLVVL